MISNSRRKKKKNSPVRYSDSQREKHEQVQQSLFEETKPHDDKLSHLVDELEAKLGKDIIKTGG